MKTERTSRTVRATLLASAAGICLSLAAGSAQAAEDPIADATLTLDVVREAQGARASGAELDPQIVIANPPAPNGNPNTTVTARDPVNVTGIGQMVIDTQDNFIGLCTGTLINPRTVLFAAHCVNNGDDGAVTLDPTIYGADSGGRPIAFGFGNNNNVGGNSAFGQYLDTNQTNQANFLYNVSQVRYNPLSVEPNAAYFLYGDLATATLDTPTRNIPTWALLFSALPARDLGTAGTGYHVALAGYGNNGTGTTGSVGGIDFRRRLAENMLGGLASLDEFENFLFGGNFSSNPQNLYWIDFDDPRRADGTATVFDRNVWTDDAVPSTKEGITASGDSGGPMILDNTYAKQVVIGVLSGGYTRFFVGAPPNGYGTAAFYQPVYLYWDWIAANNPYHYVSAVAGNGNWNDPLHWVTNLDPNYQIIGNGNVLVNGVPASPGAGNTDQPGFGNACALLDPSDCVNFGATPAPPGGQPVALPPATLANGLPGATNFVPNNVDPVRLTGAIGKYFDVTLTAAGTTTLDTAATVDRFSIGIGGGNAVLNIASAGSLTSLIDITQATGTMQVNGALNSLGDYMMVSGGLNGTGTITVPFFTSVAGTIAPATAGTIGTLNFRGNVVLASGNTYRVDLGANGASDRIAVAANGAGTGSANVGGNVVFGFGETLRGNNTYTILTASNVSGKFKDPGAFSAILTPKLLYSATAVQVHIDVGQYGNVVDRNDPVQVSYGILLDRNRPQAGNYDALYGPLDLQNQATIRSTISSFAPTTETLAQSLAIAGADNWANLIHTRVESMKAGGAGGTLARYGAPTLVAANGISALTMGGMSGMGFGADVRSDAQMPMVQENVLPETISAFVAGGYLKGDSAPMNGIGGRDDYDGWYIAGGVESSDDDTSVGLAFSYTHLDGTGAMAGQTAYAHLFQSSFYGKTEFGPVSLDGQLSAGLVDLHTSRSINFLGTPYRVRNGEGSLVFISEVGLSGDFDVGAVRITPRLAGRAQHIGFSRTAEVAGPMALMIDRAPANSIQARGGLTIAGTSAKVRPFLNATLVHDFMDRPGVFSANFVGGLGGNVFFDLNSQDHDWAEVRGGLTLDLGNVAFSASAETTIERTDVKSQAYRGSLTFKF